MSKFFVKTEQINNNDIVIIGDDVNHIINVLRMKKTDEIQICNQDTMMTALALTAIELVIFCYCALAPRFESKSARSSGCSSLW